MTIREMKNADIRTINPKSLIDIASVNTDEGLLSDESKKHYVKQIKNPYCFLVEGSIVKLVFPEHAPSLTDRLESMIYKIQGACS